MSYHFTKRADDLCNLRRTGAPRGAVAVEVKAGCDASPCVVTAVEFPRVGDPEPSWGSAAWGAAGCSTNQYSLYVDADYQENSRNYRRLS